ncbi:MAG: DUF4340 domain-containing protein [Archangiaceae bacterium]|nr:DUF4340 domain-containing protein [Archangiaceae bacterium]
MSQSARTLVMLVALLAVGLGVGLYAWKGVYEPEQKETKQKDVDEHLFPVLKLDERAVDGAVPRVEFVRLELTTSGQTSVLERESGSAPWRMSQPFAGAGVDRIAVDGITSQLQASKFKYVADEAPDAAALKKYGLESPSFTVQAEALVGEARERRKVKLVAGAENSFNGSIFMLRDDEKKVWGAEGGVKWAFQKTPFDLREKELVTLDEQQVSKIAVKTQTNDYTIERDADRQWVLKPTKPFKGEDPQFLADQGAISGAISGIKSERATGFPAAEIAFDAPTEDLTFTVGEPAQRVNVKLLKVGGGDAGSAQVYARREDAHGVVIAEVSSNALSFFDRNPFDMRDKSVLQFKKDAVAKVRVHLADGAELVVEKDATDGGGAESWRVTAPQQGPAKQFKLAALLWTLGSVKGSELIEDKPKDLKKYGFDRWIALSDASGKELARLWVGAQAKGKMDQKYLKGTRDQVVCADATRLADLPTKLDDLLEAPPAAKAPDAGP